MSQWQQAMARSLTRMAAGLQDTDLFAVERTQRAGSPSLWEESITLHHGCKQRFFRTRSPADEGGAAIGRWWAPASPTRARAVVQALAAAAIWELESAPITPGEEVICWRYVTEAGVGQVCVPAGSMLLLHLSALDLELRRVANDLTAAHDGAELSCQVSLQPLAGGGRASIWLVNEGYQEGLVPNPLLPSPRGSDFLRLEMGRLPDEEPGITGPGIVYGPLSMPPAPGVLAPPWNNPYVPLRAGDFLELPIPIPVNPPPGGRHFLRAVCSNYDPEDFIGDLPVLRGRVFSVEHELETVDGVVQIRSEAARGAPCAPAGSSSLLKTVMDH